MSADTLSRIFSALADPTRRDMVGRLARADATVNQLAERYPMSLQAVYKHLRVLEHAGLVSRPAGPQPRSVHLEAEAFQLLDQWIERYRRQAEQRYRRLDAVLAAMTDNDPTDHRPADHKPVDHRPADNDPADNDPADNDTQDGNQP